MRSFSENMKEFMLLTSPMTAQPAPRRILRGHQLLPRRVALQAAVEEAEAEFRWCGALPEELEELWESPVLKGFRLKPLRVFEGFSRVFSSFEEFLSSF